MISKRGLKQPSFPVPTPMASTYSPFCLAPVHRTELAAIKLMLMLVECSHGPPRANHNGEVTMVYHGVP